MIPTGAIDGVIDDLKTLPRGLLIQPTYVFADTGLPLQCTGDKTDSCLTPGQINAVKDINRRTKEFSWGKRSKRRQEASCPSPSR